MTSTQTLAAALRAARQRKGMTQQQLAASAGCSKNHISKLERAERWPAAVLLDRLLAALDCRLALLPPCPRSSSSPA